MAAWLMGIVTAIVFTTLIDVVLAEGESKKYIKGIASLVVLAAIIAPLPALLDSGFEFNFDAPSAGGQNPLQDEAYLTRIYMERYKGYELNLQNKLKSKGIDGVAVRINIRYSGGNVEIVNVIADTSAMVITSEDKNIDINGIIVSTIAGGLGIPEYKVIISK